MYILLTRIYDLTISPQLVLFDRLPLVHDVGVGVAYSRAIYDVGVAYNE